MRYNLALFSLTGALYGIRTQGHVSPPPVGENLREGLEKLLLIDRQKAVVHLGSAAMAQSLMCMFNYMEMDTAVTERQE